MIRIQTWNNAPRRIQAGGIAPGAQPALRSVSGTAEDRTLDAMLQGGLKLTDIAVREYVADETARVSQSLQQMNAELAAERERYMQENQGQNALKAGEHFENFAREVTERHLEDGKFQGCFAREFMQQAAGSALHFTEQGRSYAGQQRAAWRNSLLEGEISAFQNQVAQNYDNKDWIEFNLAHLVQRVEAMRPGLDNRDLLDDVRKRAAEGVIEGFLSAGRIGDARGAFSQYRDMLGDRANAVGVRIDARAAALRAQAEARRQEKERETVRSLRQEILEETAAFPTLEEQQAAALARAESLEDPKLREKVRAGIVREMDWRIRRRDAEIMRTGLEFRRAAREEGLSPEEQLARLKEMDIPPYVRAALEAELESGTQRLPNEENMSLAMTLLRSIDVSRAGGMSPAGGSSLSQEDILAAALYGGPKCGGRTDRRKEFWPIWKRETGSRSAVWTISALNWVWPRTNADKSSPLPGSMRACCVKRPKAAEGDKEEDMMPSAAARISRREGEARPSSGR